MNNYIESQCRNMIGAVNLFKQACEMGALKDDGKISKDEAKALAAIKKASDAFVKDIEKLLK